MQVAIIEHIFGQHPAHCPEHEAIREQMDAMIAAGEKVAR